MVFLTQNNLRMEREMPKSLEAALHRVMTKEELELQNSLKHNLLLSDCITQIHAAQIYVNLEKEEAESRKEEDPLPTRGEQMNDIDELHDALLNHKLAKASLQQASMKVQMQEVVSQSLFKMNPAKTLKNFPVNSKLMTQLAKNAPICSELAAVLKQKRELDKDILQLRLAYTDTVKSIKSNWIAIERNQILITADTPEIKKKKTDLHDREWKLQLLVTMVQGLVCGSGLHWAKHQYYIRLLKMCDTVVRNATREEQDKYRKGLPELRVKMVSHAVIHGKKKEHKIDSSKKKQRKLSVHKKFFTSTPKPKH